MEITDGNLHVLAGYLQKTLSPDPVERRGGLTITQYKFIQHQSVTLPVDLEELATRLG